MSTYELAITLLFVSAPFYPENISVSVEETISSHILVVEFETIANSNQESFELNICTVSDSCEENILTKTVDVTEDKTYWIHRIDVGFHFEPGVYNLSVRAEAYGKYSEYSKSTFEVCK